MSPSSNSMLCLRYKLPEWQELSTQIQSHLLTTLKWGGREIGLRILLNYCLEKTFLKRGILRQECVKKNMTIFLIDCMKQGFLISFYQILSQKVLKMNVKITDISGAKINLFYIFRRQNSVRKTYSMCCRTLQRVRVTRYHRFSLKFIWFGAIYNALPRVTTKIT